jgi:SAM-dependent methyltransferase
MPRPRAHTAEHADFYASPAIYDILHTPGTAREVAALERLARRFLGRGPWSILEPACGTGRYLRLLAAHGHTAIGFDRDPGMVAYAAARLARFPSAHVFQADMESFADAIRAPARGSARSAPRADRRGRSAVKPGTIDLAFTPINSIRHLHSDRDMLAHFGQVARVLKPAGIYAVGISLTAYGLEEPSEDLWQGARGPCRVRQLVQYLPAPGGPGRHARDEAVISHMTVRTPGRTRHIDSTYTLRAYDLAQWRRLIARSPLEIAAIVDESGRDLTPAPPGYAVFILTTKTPA